MTWDEERIRGILKPKDFRMRQRKEETVIEIQALVTSVRNEAITWTWVQACQQHAMGLDPNRTKAKPDLFEKALADLNPERDKKL